MEGNHLRRSSRKKHHEKNPVILSSGLHLHGRKWLQSFKGDIEKFLHMSGGTESNTYRSDVTHVIVPADEHRITTARTLKVFTAVLDGIPVIDVSWIKDSVAHGCVLHEGKYRIVGDNVIGKWKFGKRQFFFKSPVFVTELQDVSKEAVEMLIRKMGGKTVDDPLNALVIGNGPIFPADHDQKVVDIHWIFDSIVSGKMLDKKSYLYDVTDIVNQICEETFDWEAIDEDVPFNYSRSKRNSTKGQSKEKINDQDVVELDSDEDRMYDESDSDWVPDDCSDEGMETDSDCDVDMKDINCKKIGDDGENLRFHMHTSQEENGEKSVSIVAKNSTDKTTFSLTVKKPSEKTTKSSSQHSHTARKKSYSCKKHCCLYCERFYNNISRHYGKKHKNETYVAKILVIAKGSDVRKKMWSKLVNRGDLLHNYKVLQQKQGIFIPKYKRGVTKNYSAHVPCRFCCGTFDVRNLAKHQRNCKEEESQDNIRPVDTQSPIPSSIESLKLHIYETALTKYPEDERTIKKNSESVIKVPDQLVQNKAKLHGNNSTSDEKETERCQDKSNDIGSCLSRENNDSGINQEDGIHQDEMMNDNHVNKDMAGKEDSDHEKTHCLDSNKEVCSYGNITDKCIDTFMKILTGKDRERSSDQDTPSIKEISSTEKSCGVKDNEMQVCDFEKVDTNCGETLLSVPASNQTLKSDPPSNQSETNENSDNSFKQNSSALHEQIQSSAQSTTGISVQAVARLGGNKLSQKLQSCFYCKKKYPNIARHYQGVHKNEKEVIDILDAPKHSKVRRALWSKLVNKGNFNHNYNVLQKKEGTLITKCRVGKGRRSKGHNMYVPCEFCLGSFVAEHLWQHQKYCNSKESNDVQRKPIARGRMLLPFVGSKELFENIINKMRDDNIKMTIQNDPMIIQYGERLFEKYGAKTHQNNLISQKLRELGRLLLHLKENSSDVDTIEKCLHPCNWETVITAVRSVAGFCKTSQTYTNPSLPLKLGQSFTKCAGILKTQAIKDDDSKKRKQAKDFLKLYEEEWHDRISANCRSTLQINKQKRGCDDHDNLNSDQEKNKKSCNDTEGVKKNQDDHSSVNKRQDGCNAVSNGLICHGVKTNHNDLNEVNKGCLDVDAVSKTHKNSDVANEGFDEQEGVKNLDNQEDMNRNLNNSFEVNKNLEDQGRVNENLNGQDDVNKNINDHDGMNKNLDDKDPENKNLDGQDGRNKNSNDQDGVNKNLDDQDGVNKNLNDQYEVNVTNLDDQDGMNKNSDDQDRVNKNLDDQDGVNKNLNDQSEGNKHLNDQNEMNKNLDEQEGTNKNSDDQDGVNNSLDEQDGKGNSCDDQEEVYMEDDELNINCDNQAKASSDGEVKKKSSHEAMKISVAKTENKVRLWSLSEKRAVQRQLGEFIKDQILPGKLECELAIEQEKELESRSWQQIKNFVRNKIVSLKRKQSHTAEEEPSIERNKARSWTESEQEAVQRQLGKFIDDKHLPGKADCERAKSNEKDLSRRSWINIKDFVRNKIVSIKRKSCGK